MSRNATPIRRSAIVLSGVVLWTAPSTAQPESLKVYYGLLHSHTCFSDGSGTPEEAFAMAKQTGLDFFAVTEHNHDQAESRAGDRRDGILIATNPALYNSNDRVNIQRNSGTESVLSLKRAAEQAGGASFVALIGQEFSSISKGNHVNVLEVPNVLANASGDFQSLYATLRTTPDLTGGTPVVQLNHPDVHLDLFYAGSNEDTQENMNNDYGIDGGDLGPHFSSLVQASDPFVALIEVLSGPAMAEQRQAPYHYEETHENDYYFYLTQGFHISPSAGQDNHYPTWGTATDARTGVLCSSLTKQGLLEAMRRNRTFATEDKNLDLRFSANGNLMGSTLVLAANGDVKFEVALQDPDDSTTDYEIRLYHGLVDPKTRSQVPNWKLKDGFEDKYTLHGNGMLTIPDYVASGDHEFFFVKVAQEDGDRAWSAPIWIRPSAADAPTTPESAAAADAFVWAADSTVYHRPDCSSVPRIANPLRGPTPPAGRNLCARCKNRTAPGDGGGH